MGSVNRARQNLRGPRAALDADEMAELCAEARRIMLEYPDGRAGGWKSTVRSDQLGHLADRYGVSLRTLYRYLHVQRIERVLLGEWAADFAIRDGRPVQLTRWERAA